MSYFNTSVLNIYSSPIIVNQYLRINQSRL